MSARISASILIATLAWIAADPIAERVSRKIETIENRQAKPGSVIVFTAGELNAWARVKAKEVVPEGLREPRLELGNGTATAYALVDFLKMRQSAGIESSWLVAKLIEGEKRVKVTASLQSSKGRATVHLMRVEIGGLAVSGAPLDLLIETFFTPLYPEAKIDQPFDLAAGLERIEVTPALARACIQK